MPSVGCFLELFEAISRRDFQAVLEIAREVAEKERSLKHYAAAHQIMEAVETAVSRAGLDRIGTLSSPTEPLRSAPPDILHLDRLESEVAPPILTSSTEKELNELLSEWQNEEKLRAQGLHPRRSILLFGPPGCGKTITARFLAKSLKMPLYILRFDTLISSYLGETSGNLKSVFDFARANRCAILFDEIDAIAKLRDDKNELGELKRVVISLLQNFDLLTGKGLLLGATNHPHMLDPAIWRRFELVIELKLPAPDARLRILERYIQGRIPSEIQESLRDASEGLTGADLDQIGLAARKRHILIPDSSFDECLLYAFVAQLRRNREAAQTTDKSDDRIFTLARELRRIGGKKYSFQELESLTGISHSTLHHRISTMSDGA